MGGREHNPDRWRRHHPPGRRAHAVWSHRPRVLLRGRPLGGRRDAAAVSLDRLESSCGHEPLDGRCVGSLPLAFHVRARGGRRPGAADERTTRRGHWRGRDGVGPLGPGGAEADASILGRGRLHGDDGGAGAAGRGVGVARRAAAAWPRGGDGGGGVGPVDRRARGGGRRVGCRATCGGGHGAGGRNGSVGGGRLVAVVGDREPDAGRRDDVGDAAGSPVDGRRGAAEGRHGPAVDGRRAGGSRRRRSGAVVGRDTVGRGTRGGSCAHGGPEPVPGPGGGTVRLLGGDR